MIIEIQLNKATTWIVLVLLLNKLATQKPPDMLKYKWNIYKTDHAFIMKQT